MAITAANAMNEAIAGKLPMVTIIKNGVTMEAIGVFHSTFYTGIVPAGGVANSAGMEGVALTSVQGQIPFPAPAAGKTTYLHKLKAFCTTTQKMYIADRLWHQSGINQNTVGTPQVISAPADPATYFPFPPRDENFSSNGVGVMIGLEASVAGTNSVSTATVIYTNSDGVSDRTGTISINSSIALGTLCVMGLQGDDKGVRSVQSITLNTAVTSAILHLVAFRFLTSIVTVGSSSAGYYSEVDPFTGEFPALADYTVPWVVILPSTTAGTTLIMDITYTQV